MSLKIYNTLTRKKTLFTPLKAGQVSMYVCGPTVYDFLHIGNFRGAIFFNLVRNWLEHLGYKVTYVYNYTDIDDKIIKRANEESLSTTDVAGKYIMEFEKDYKTLGLKPHTHNPKATEYIPDMVAMIQRLMDHKKAYLAESGEVFYAIDQFAEYGKLSGKNIEDLQAGARVEIGEQKCNPLDFVLWKPSKENEPAWDSPWGKGRPGWHLECSVMNCRLLGETVDIHGGGMDLIFPHHENETAQSEGTFEKPFVRYWMHHHLIQFGAAGSKAEKMSKSLGNIITARHFLSKYHPEILKYMMLMNHYRSPSLFNDSQIQNAIAGLGRIYMALNLAGQIQEQQGGSSQQELKEAHIKKFKTLIETAQHKVTEALNDDFNTPKVFACLFEVVRAFNALCDSHKNQNTSLLSKIFEDFIKKQGALLALFREKPDVFLEQINDILLKKKQMTREAIGNLIQERNKARKAKDYQKSDEIRDLLTSKGIKIQDLPDKTVWTLIPDI